MAGKRCNVCGQFKAAPVLRATDYYSVKRGAWEFGLVCRDCPTYPGAVLAAKTPEPIVKDYPPVEQAVQLHAAAGRTKRVLKERRQGLSEEALVRLADFQKSTQAVREAVYRPQPKRDNWFLRRLRRLLGR